MRANFNSDARPDDASFVDIKDARRVHDQLLASRPDGASHNADICQFCVDKATESTSTASRIPPADGGPDVSESQSVPNEHGGRDTHPMSDTKMISEETHQALLNKAVADATSVTEKALETKTAEADQFKTEKAELEKANADLKADNERLNGELDKAQVSLKSAQDEVASLKADIAQREEQATKAELASKRAEQVKNLKLYDDDYVAERASQWADLSDDDWASRLDEWAKIRPADTTATKTTDTASAMSGTSGNLTEEPNSTDTAGDQSTKPTARRAVLGLS